VGGSAKGIPLKVSTVPEVEPTIVAAGAAIVTVGVVARFTSSTGAASAAYGTKAKDRRVSDHFMMKYLKRLPERIVML
jgi:hypothetical protein